MILQTEKYFWDFVNITNMSWVNKMDAPLSKHLLNKYVLVLLPYEVIYILKLHMFFWTNCLYSVILQWFFFHLYIGIYMQFYFAGYVSSVWDWEKLIFNDMFKNTGYVTGQGFPSSAEGWGESEMLLGGDFFIRFWETEVECIWSYESQSIKATFSKYQTSVKIKISMTCVYIEHKVSRGMSKYIYIILSKVLGKVFKKIYQAGSSF